MSGINVIQVGKDVGAFFNSWVTYVNAAQQYSNDPDSSDAKQGLIASAQALSAAIATLGKSPTLAAALGGLAGVTDIPVQVNAYQDAVRQEQVNGQTAALSSIAGDAAGIAGTAATVISALATQAGNSELAELMDGIVEHANDFALVVGAVGTAVDLGNWFNSTFLPGFNKWTGNTPPQLDQDMLLPMNDPNDNSEIIMPGEVGDTLVETSLSGVPFTYTESNPQGSVIGSVQLAYNGSADDLTVLGSGVVADVGGFQINIAKGNSAEISGTNDQIKTGSNSLLAFGSSQTTAAVTVDNQGNATVQTAANAAGISQFIFFNSNGAGSITVGGQSVLDFGAGSDIGVNAGNITVTSAPASGWTDNIQLGQLGGLTQTFSSTDASGSAIALNYSEAGSAVGAGSSQLNGATFNGQTVSIGDAASFPSAVFDDVASSGQTQSATTAALTGSALAGEQSTIQSAIESGDTAILAGDGGSLLAPLASVLVDVATDAALFSALTSAVETDTGTVVAIVPQDNTPPTAPPPGFTYDPDLPSVPDDPSGTIVIENGGNSDTVTGGILTSATVDGTTFDTPALTDFAGEDGSDDLQTFDSFLTSLLGDDNTGAADYFGALSGEGIFTGTGTGDDPWTYVPGAGSSLSLENGASVTIPGVSLLTAAQLEQAALGDGGLFNDEEEHDDSDSTPPPPSEENTDDPLVLSLDGQGINLLSLQQSNSAYGYGPNGAPLHTGWIGADTGILVEVNPDGSVSLVENFAELATLDGSHDGVLDSSDPDFANLQVWADTNGDGVIQSGELVSLASLGIKSINVGATATNQVVAGNTISAVGSLTFNNGQTEAVDDVTFAGKPDVQAAVLDGQSAAALEFYSRVLEYRPSTAEGAAQQIAQSISSLVSDANSWASSPSSESGYRGSLNDINDVHVVDGDTLVYNQASPTYGTIVELSYQDVYMLDANGHVQWADVNDPVAAAASPVAAALSAMEAASQAVVSATMNQSNSEDAAMTADAQEASVGSVADQGASVSAAATEEAWLAAFTSIATAMATIPQAAAALATSNGALSAGELPSGASYLTTQDAQEMMTALDEQDNLTQSLVNGTAAFQTLLSAVAQAWDVSHVTLALPGTTVQASGGDLVLATAGTENLSDGATAGTYVILPGAQVQIANFHAGLNGSRIDFLNPGSTVSITSVSGGTLIKNGTSSVLLQGVSIAQLSLYDNLAGASAASITGVNATAMSLASGSSDIDDGTTHINTLSVNGSSDTLIGNGGTDVLIATGTSNVLVSGSGVSMLNATGSTNTLIGGAGTDELLISGTGTHNVLEGGTGTEQLTVDGTASQQEADTLVAGNGNDVLRVTGSLDTLIAGEGVDALFAVGNQNTLVGGSGDDLLSVTEGSGNVLIGGTSTSELVSDASGNTLVGGTGLTQAFYAANAMTVNLAAGTASINGSGTGDTLVGVASADVVGSHDTLIGGSLNGTLWGSGQGDTLIGGSGGSVLVSNMDQNTLEAGTGGAQVLYTYNDIVINLAAGTVTNAEGGGTSDVLIGIKGAVATGDDNTLIGTAAGGNVLIVSGTGDTLIASGADNTLGGGVGSTLIASQVGSNTLLAGTGQTELSYTASGMTVDLGTGIATTTGTAASDTLVGAFAIVQVTGSHDTVIGGGGTSTLASNAAGNTLIAGTGSTQAWYGIDDLTVNLGAETAHVNGASLGDTFFGIDAAVVAGSDDTLVSSGTGDDILIAAGNDDTLVALGTGNTLEGGKGVATLIGDAAGNTLIAGTGPTVVSYGSGVAVNLAAGTAVLNGTHDSLVGVTIAQATGSNEVLTGGSTASTLMSNAAGNTLIAGTALTTVDYSGDNLTVDLDSGIADVSHTSQADTLVGIKAAVISGDGNTLIGGNGDVLTNVSGNSDELVATGSNETLQGGSGNSTLVSSAAGNTLLGGTGTTTAEYSASGIRIDLATGTVTGSGGSGVIKGIGDVQISGSNDTLIGSTTGNTLSVIGNNDTVQGSSHGVLEAKGNDDTLIASIGGGDFLEAVSGSGNTLVTSGSGDTLEGGTGDTTLISDAAGNTLIGGTGHTVVSYSGAGITVNLKTGTEIANGASVGDTLIGITAAEVSGFGDTLIGSDTGGDDLEALGIGDTLTADGGGDVLKAGSGSSTLASNAAGNTLIGGAGTATAYYGGDDVIVNLADGTAEVNGADVSDTLESIGIAQAGGSGDTLYGGAGVTTLVSNGAGNTLVAGTNRTVVSYDDSDLTVNLSSGTAGGNGGSASDALIGIMAGSVSGNNDTLVGGLSGGDFLAATGADDTLIASGSGNTLEGASGSDTLITNAAGNTLVGGAGATAAFYTGNSLTVNLANGSVTAAGAAAGALAGVSDVIVAGTSDILIAGSGNDTLAAEGSHDVLEGGTGISTLTGNGNSNTLKAGSGLTVAEYSGHGTAINLATQHVTVSGTSGDSLVGITVAEAAGSGETLVGINGAMSTLIGNAEGNTLIGGSIYEATYVNSQTHTETLATLQTVAYYADNNISATKTSVSVNGSGIADVLIGVSDIEIIGDDDSFAGSGATLTGDHDTISGSGTLTGNDDTLIGNGSIVGNDSTLIGTGTISGDSNIATGSYLIASSGANNVLIGSGTGDDWLQGGVGTTTLVSTGLFNSLEGWTGPTIAQYASNVYVDLGNQMAEQWSVYWNALTYNTGGYAPGDQGYEGDTLHGVSIAQASGSGDILIAGDNDTIGGNGEGNTLIAQFYEDTLFPQESRDALNSEAYFYANNLSISVGTTGVGYATSAQGRDTIVGEFWEYAVSGDNDYMAAYGGFNEASGNNDTIVGGNTVEATGNNDELIGGGTLLATGYNDTLVDGYLMEGGAGISILVGVAGGAELIAGSGVTVASYGDYVFYNTASGFYPNEWLQSETLDSTGLVVNLGDGTVRGGTTIYRSDFVYEGTSSIENSIVANVGVDTLVGITVAQATASGETLIGGAGITTLISDLQGNTLTTGTGRTIAYYSQNDVNIQLGAAGQSGEASAGLDGIGSLPGLVADVLVGIRGVEITGTGDYVVGSSAGGNLLETAGTDDTLLSSGKGNTLLVVGGTDNVLTGSGGDIMEVTGGVANELKSAGNSTLEAMGGSNNELFAASDDTLIGSGGSSILVGDLDNNTLIAASGQITAEYGAAGLGTVVDLATEIATDAAGDADTLIGISSAEVSGPNSTLIGSNSGGDYLQIAGVGSMAIAAGSGNTLSGARGATLISSSIGGNTLTTTAARLVPGIAYYSESFMTINLGSGIASGYGRENDTLIGMAEIETAGQDETLIGGSTASTLAVAMVDGNTLIAGSGATEALYTENNVSINLANGLVDSNDSADDTLVGTFAIAGVSGSHDVLRGGAGPVELVSTGKDDTLIAGAGSTTMISNMAGNTLVAGSAPTMLDYATAKSTIDLLTGIADTLGASDTLIGVFSGIVASGADSTLIGSANGADLLEATGTGDTVIANGSGNTLKDTTGTATLLSETVGNNTLVGGVPPQTGVGGTVAEYTETNAVVNLATDRATEAGSVADTLVGISIAEAAGAHDTLIGSSVASTLIGGLDNDTLIAGTGRTEAAYLGAGVVINLSTSSATGGGASDSLVGIKAVFVGGANDTLIGPSTGGDTLMAAWNDNDTLIGNLDGNTLEGGGTAWYSESDVHVTFSVTSSDDIVGAITASINGVSRSDELEDLNAVELTGNDDTIVNTFGATIYADGIGDTLIGGANGSNFESDAAGNTLMAAAGASPASNNVFYDGNGITVDLGAGTAKAQGATFGDKLVGFASASMNGDHDVLSAGSVANAVLQSSGTENTLVAGTGENDEIFDAGLGHDYFDVGVGDGAVMIYNGGETIPVTPTNELDFGTGVSDTNLWFAQSGNNLLIDVLGTNTSVDIAGWFSGGYDQLEKITAGGLTVDSKVSQLVQAMATYSSENPGFNPVTATQMPTDTALHSVIASAWHA